MGNLTKEKLVQDLREMVAEILEVEPDTIEGDAGFVKDLGMDSMMALEILAGIEKKYGNIVPEDSLPKFTSLNKTVEIIRNVMGDKVAA
jgi:acyl carrier protein